MIAWHGTVRYGTIWYGMVLYAYVCVCVCVCVCVRSVALLAQVCHSLLTLAGYAGWGGLEHPLLPAQASGC